VVVTRRHVTALVVASLAAGLAFIVWAVPRAKAAEFEIYAERSGAYMRPDEPNSRRYRDRNAEPFDTRENCEQAAAGERRFAELGPGWHLRCRPLHVPAPRMVVR
jgi:hypothetical protein